MDRTKKIAVVLCGTFLAVAALAVDPPHDPSQGRKCSDCHIMHSTLGGSLTSASTNANLCDSCHGLVTDTDGKHFGFPWVSTLAQAVPGTSGHSHRWDALTTNLGANAPTDTNMAGHLDGTKITCSTCHDVHNNTLDARTGTQHVGGSTGTGTVAVGSTWAPNGNPGTKGTGTMTLSTVTANAASKGYRVRVAAKSGSQITVDVSHNAGGTFVTLAGGTVSVPTASPVNLDDGTNVQVSFGSALANYNVGDYWEFWVSYPFLQMANTDGAICLQCHQARNQTYQNVQGTGTIAGGPIVLGTTVFSHPVGQTLNANAQGYDVAPTAIRDANGILQTTGDGNRTNDLVLGSTGVNCMTCHNPHNADSNSLSVDPR